MEMKYVVIVLMAVAFANVAEGQVCPDGVVGTTKTTSSINSKTCTLKVTCPANTKLVTGNTDGNQFVQCVNCNKGTGLGDTPKGCDAICDSSSCDVSGDRGCKWSDSGAETCSACEATTKTKSASGKFQDARPHSAEKPCRSSCNECKHEGDCIWVAAWNANDATKKYQMSSNDNDSTCQKEGSW